MILRRVIGTYLYPNWQSFSDVNRIVNGIKHQETITKSDSVTVKKLERRRRPTQ